MSIFYCRGLNLRRLVRRMLVKAVPTNLSVQKDPKGLTLICHLSESG